LNPGTIVDRYPCMVITLQIIFCHCAIVLKILEENILVIKKGEETAQKDVISEITGWYV